MTKTATNKRIYLTRHGQAQHNVDENSDIPDAPLTDLGRDQARRLHDLTKDSVQKTAELIVCSPLCRPMDTMMLAYPDLHKRLEGEGKEVIILDIVQEVQAVPSDTPSHPPTKIQSAQNGLFAKFNFNNLSPDYASKQGIFDPARVQERARLVRRWLRDREEGEIVVVAHGDILRSVVFNNPDSGPWENAECGIYTFRSDADDAAELVKVGDIAVDNATK